MAASSLKFLPPVIEVPNTTHNVDGTNHPYRRLTQELAQQAQDAWSLETAFQVQANFDEMAPGWEARFLPNEIQTLNDALKRGEVSKKASCLELGAGTGLGTKVLRDWCRLVTAVDVSYEMLCLGDRQSRRVQADAARLPFEDGAFELVALVNMFLFPKEVDRVLKKSPQAKLIWFNSLGSDTPIYLPAETVADVLPGSWSGIASTAGWASWCVLNRS